MKRIIIVLSIFVCSCAGPSREKLTHIDKTTLLVTVTDTYTGKYSKVNGYTYYKGIPLFVDNGNTGYHYKKYSIKTGDVVESEFDVYVKQENNRTYVELSDMKLSKYEVE